MMSELATAESSRARSLWRNVSFMLMWSSVAASGFGDRVIMLVGETMLGAQEPGVNAAPLQAGIAFFFFAPYLILTIVGGWLADRLPRKWLMLACDEGRAVVLLLAWLWMAEMTAVTIPPDSFWRVYVIIAVTGALAAIFNPAKFAAIPQIVHTKNLQQANAVLAGIAIVASLVGFSVGAAMIGPGASNSATDSFVDSMSMEKTVGSLRNTVLVGAVCFGVSGLFFAFLKPRFGGHVDTRREPLPRQLIEAFSYLRRHRAVRTLVVLNILFWTGSWVLVAALSSLAKSHYGLPEERYIEFKSELMACLGGGMLAGSLCMLLVKNRRETDILAMLALLMAGLLMLTLTVNRSFVVGKFLTFGVGAFGALFLVMVDTLTQTITPNYIRGRVFGLRSMLNTTGTVVVNGIIWQLPNNADQVMLPALAVTATILLLVSLRAVRRQLIAGPMTARPNLLWHVTRMFCLTWHRLRWVGRDNIPSSGRVLLASNHTTGIDPFLIQSACPRMIRWVMWRAYRFRIFNFLWNAIDPVVVEQDGNDLAALRELLRELKTNDSIVGIFPEGGLQREHRELQPFEAGIGFLAKKSGAVIVPVWLSGTPRTRSMLWHFLWRSKAVVVFGEPYMPDPTLTNTQIAEDLQRRMLALAECQGDG